MNIEILITDLIAFSFTDYRYREIRLSKKNFSYNSNYDFIYETDLIKKVEYTFNSLNEMNTNYGEYLSPYYITYIDIEILKSIANNLYLIEKKKNKYLTIEVFKDRYFGNQLYYNKAFLTSKYSKLQWIIDDCYYLQEFGDFPHKHIYIFDDYFENEEMILDYFTALDKMLKEFQPSIEAITDNTDSHVKIKIKGSLQSIGYLFTKLTENGYIEPLKRNGKINKSALAKQIVDNFEFVDRDDQPSYEDVRKTLFDDNKLQYDKQELFKNFPTCKKINTD